MDEPDQEFGIEFHQIGIDLIRSLISSEITTTDPTDIDPTSVPELMHLTTAAFVAPDRDRSTSFEKIERREKEKQSIIDQSPDDEPIPTHTEGIHIEAEDASYQEIQSISAVEEDESIGDLTASSYDVILGLRDKTSPQYGILGLVSGRKIALDLNQTHTISLFGVQGSGKSYTLGSIIEMACLDIPNINKLPSPLSTVVFHYSQTQDYPPEFTSMVSPNKDASQVDRLVEFYRAKPANLTDITILVPKAKLEIRRQEYPNIEVLPIAFSASELQASHWKFLMGAVGSQSMYLRQINLIFRKLRNKLTLDKLVSEIEKSSLSDYLIDLALTRINFAAEYIDDNIRLANVIKPGRLIIVDLRDEFIEKDEALGLFVVLLQIFSEATYQGRSFNKLVVFDEAHKYIENQDLISGLIDVVREMRHKGTSILVASQDPPSVPVSLIELSSQIILHKFNSPSWLKHIQRANASLDFLTSQMMSQLSTGEAYVWSNKASDDRVYKRRCQNSLSSQSDSTRR